MVAGKVVDISLIPNIKKKKGKKKESAVAPALERIMGYAGSDMSEEEVRSGGLGWECLPGQGRARQGKGGGAELLGVGADCSGLEKVQESGCNPV